MFSQNKTQTRRRMFLHSSALALTGFVATGGVYAQETDGTGGDEIVVTGSRVPNANLTSASPVTTIDAAEFELSGATRVEDLLNTFPQLQPTFDAFTVNPATGTATADLRGLGANRTLVLVNGSRLQPGGIRTQAVDLNQIPAALVKRVEVLTGGASSVYGSDAVAGVVNFILDDEFEGVALSGTINGFQHNSDNAYMRGLQQSAGFDLVEGSSGIDGKSYTVDFAVGSGFDDGRGHAMAYFTYRKQDELLQGARDYSNCALNGSGTSCGGSATAPDPNFLIFDPGNTLAGQGFFAHQDAGGVWQPGQDQVYNYAPINHYLRPEDRFTFGAAAHYEVSPAFRPYIETMFTSTDTSFQIAQSGTFFVNAFNLDCDDPLLGTACADLGIPTTPGDDNDALVYVGKRNVEGGPRISQLASDSFRIKAGVSGEFGDSWSYDASWLYGRNASSEVSINDFISSRLQDAIEGCPTGAFTGCVPYDVFTEGGVTAAQAAGLAGTGIRTGFSDMLVVSGYVAGETGFVIPWATNAVSLVAGIEYRDSNYERQTDSNWQAGAFLGGGGPRTPISGGVNVLEFYIESGVPVLQDKGLLDGLYLDLGYRYSDYSTSGGVSTFKIGAKADIADMLSVRGSFNRAIRAANVGELFLTTQIGLFSGTDPCAGLTPTFTAAQCANTGVSAAQYGNIPASPASQYNNVIGGNPTLDPETADTFTVGFVAQPFDGFQLSVDYFDIAITDRIGTIGAQTILNFCGTTGDPFLCNRVVRNANSGDLWVGSTLGTSGAITNLNANFGEFNFDGIDFVANYSGDVLGGGVSANFVGTYTLKQETAPLPGVNDSATFDCVGVVNTSCNAPLAWSWKHTLRVSYSQDWWSGSVRWRYLSGLDYTNVNGTPGTADSLLVGNGNRLDAFNYIDLTAGFDVTDFASLTVGVNNIFDKEPPLVGGGLAFNANSLPGYDQLGRNLFASVNLRF